jgi:chromosome segregation ATPase
VLGKREAEIDSESVGVEKRLAARARELDERELDLSKKAGDVTTRIEQLEQQTASHMAAVQEARAKLEEAQVLGQGLAERQAQLASVEAELTQAQAQLEARENVIAKHEAQLAERRAADGSGAGARPA